MSKLIFNMSVSPFGKKIARLREGSGKPRYGPPDAPLDSCPLVFARVRYHLRRPGSPYLFFLSVWNGYLLATVTAFKAPRTPQPRPEPVRIHLYSCSLGIIGRWGGAPESPYATLRFYKPL